MKVKNITKARAHARRRQAALERMPYCRRYESNCDYCGTGVFKGAHIKRLRLGLRREIREQLS